MQVSDNINTAPPPRVPRSYLFVPGDRPERFEKACKAGADAVILDLEDAVQPQNKSAARDHVRHWLASGNPAYVRINAADTAWFEEDLALCGAQALAGLVLPKAERVEDVVGVAQRCASGAQLVLLIESAQGFSRMESLAGIAGVRRLAFGSIDFALDLGIEGDGEELLYFRSRMVLASRLAGLPAPIDGVTVAVNDDAQLASDTERAKRLGFGARLCIHPRQIAAVHAGLTPTSEQVDWARRVLELSSSSEGAFVLDGRMVDRPVIQRAQALLSRIAQ